MLIMFKCIFIVSRLYNKEESGLNQPRFHIVFNLLMLELNSKMNVIDVRLKMQFWEFVYDFFNKNGFMEVYGSDFVTFSC